MVIPGAGYATTDIRNYLKAWSEKTHLVIYLEESADWGFLKDVFNDLLEVASTPIIILKSFKESIQSSVREYFVGKGLLRVYLFRVLPAKILVTTMTDIGNLGLSKSINGTKYVYIFHSLASINAVYLEAAFDNYDYIFACHEVHVDELIARRAISHSLFKIYKGGYPRLDGIRSQVANESNLKAGINGESRYQRKKILIAPTWGPSAISPHQLQQIYQYLNDDYDFILRLHPMVSTRKKGRRYLSEVTELNLPALKIKTDVSLVSDFIESDVLITDWSGTALEFSYGTGRPTISIDTPRKIRNANFEVNTETLESRVRGEIGVVLNPESLSNIKEVISELLQLERLEIISKGIEKSSQGIFNPGTASITIAREILNLLEGQENSSSWI